MAKLANVFLEQLEPGVRDLSHALKARSQGASNQWLNDQRISATRVNLAREREINQRAEDLSRERGLKYDQAKEVAKREQDIADAFSAEMTRRAGGVVGGPEHEMALAGEPPEIQAAAGNNLEPIARALFHPGAKYDKPEDIGSLARLFDVMAGERAFSDKERYGLDAARGKTGALKTGVSMDDREAQEREIYDRSVTKMREQKALDQQNRIAQDKAKSQLPGKGGKADKYKRFTDRDITARFSVPDEDGKPQPDIASYNEFSRWSRANGYMDEHEAYLDWENVKAEEADAARQAELAAIAPLANEFGASPDEMLKLREFHEEGVARGGGVPIEAPPSVRQTDSPLSQVFKGPSKKPAVVAEQADMTGLSDAEADAMYDALPKGAIYIGPDGVPRVK